jgi:hypothetical protein
VVAMAVIVLLMALVAVIFVTARRLASRTEAVLVALGEVRAKTLALAELEGAERPSPPEGGGRPGSGNLAGSPDPA